MVDTTKASLLANKLVNLTTKEEFELSLAKAKEKLLVGRLDKNKIPDIDLKDKKCSRETGEINYVSKHNQEFYTLSHIGSCVLGYVLKKDKPFQLLEGLVLDLGGEAKNLLTFRELNPKK